MSDNEGEYEGEPGLTVPPKPLSKAPLKPPKSMAEIKAEIMAFLQWFDKMYMEKPCLTLLLGKSMSGKSYLVKWLLFRYIFEKKFLKFGVVFTGSGFNKDYDYIDKDYVFNGFDEEVHQRYIEKLQKMKEEKGDKMPANFIVYDDLLDLIKKSRSVTNWFSIFRHTNTYIFLGNQTLKNQTSSTLVRTQSKFIFAFRDRTKSLRNALYEWFGGLCDSQDHFNSIFENATAEQHTAMMIVADQDTLKETFKSFKAGSTTDNIRIKFGKQGQKMDMTVEKKEKEESQDDIDPVEKFKIKQRLESIAASQGLFSN